MFSPTLFQVQVLLFIAPSLLALYAYFYPRKSKYASQPTSKPPPPPPPPEANPWLIQPLPSFNYRTSEPLKLRPFKPTFHLTMGLRTISFSELIHIDRNYLSCITRRRQTLKKKEGAVRAMPEVGPAVKELYSWLVGGYLPVRFPGLFEREGEGQGLRNTATGGSMPLLPPEDPVGVFKLLGENLDEDILILLPTPGTNSQGETYTLRGFTVCNPSGFNTDSKLGLPLAAIHAPVPGYKAKLELSMDRFFRRLEVGRLVSRSNWSVQTHGEWWADGLGNHIYADPAHAPSSEAQARDEVDVGKEVDTANTHLRCERQTLFRLPGTEALVFMFKTYLENVGDLKESGDGEALAEAIEGLRAGSVKGMWVYKSAVVWGRRVVEFLRS